MKQHRRTASDAEPGESDARTDDGTATSCSEERWTEQARWLANRANKNFRHLRRSMAREGTTAFRIYDRDIPELPFAIDWYDGALHVAEYARPHDRTPDEHERWVTRMVDEVSQSLGVASDATWVKRRERQRGRAQYQRMAEQGVWRVVQEHGLSLRVNLSDYLDTGLFLDHRPLRAEVGRRSEGRSVLNLFGYTGAFSVHAAVGRATRVTTVDLSKTYLAWGEENFRLNDITPELHGWVAADVMEWIREAARGRPSWDLVIIDPPTFSNSRRTSEDFDVQQAHAELLTCAARVTRPGGVILFSTNSKRFRWEGEHVHGCVAEEISNRTIPPDFRNRRIHRVWELRRDDT